MIGIGLSITRTAGQRPLPISLSWSLDNESTIESNDRVSAATNPYSRGGSFAQVTDANRPRRIYLDTGPVLHMAGGSQRMQSDLGAAAFADLHDATSERTIAFRFRVYDLSSTNVVLRTYNSSASSVGVFCSITNAGYFQFLIGNGTANTQLLSSVGAIQEGVTYTALIRKAGVDWSMYIDDMVTAADSDTVSSPSASNPSEALLIGATSNSLNGLISELLIVDAAADQSMRERIAHRLAKHDLQSMMAELDVAYPPGEIAAGAVLQKTHAAPDNTHSWDVATRTSGGSDIAVWSFSTRIGSTSTVGPARLRWAHRGNCWDSTRYHLDHDDAARSGTWTDASGLTALFGGNLINEVSRANVDSSGSVTYTVTCEAGDKIAWEYVGSTAGAVAHFVIRDSLNAEIGSGEYEIPDDGSGNRYVDTEVVGGVNNELKTAVVATVADADTYTVEITVAAGEGSGRIYDRAVYVLDPDTAGDLAVDPWITGQMVLGTGEVTIAVHDGTDFVTGAHGGEDPFSDLVAMVDSTDRADALAEVGSTEAGTRWAGSEVTIRYSTEHSAGWAAWDYEFAIDRYGCANNMRRTMRAAQGISYEYVAMLQAPNLANGGFDRVAIDVEPREFFQIGTTTPETNVNEEPSANNGSTFYTDTFAIAVRCRMPSLAATDENSVTPALLNDRADGEIKDYRALVRQSTTADDIAVPAGQVRAWSARYRCVPGSDLFTLIGT